MKKFTNAILGLVVGLGLAGAVGVLAQTSTGITGGGVTGGGGSPKGSNFATQYKNGTQFGGTGPGTAGQVLTSNGAGAAPTYQAAGGGAPTNATYITQTANGTLTNEQALGALATGILKSTTTTGVVSTAASSDVISLWSGTCNSTTFLRADGSCQAAGGGTPAGANTQVQFNNAGAFGATSDFTWTSGTSTLVIGAASSTTNFRGGTTGTFNIIGGDGSGPGGPGGAVVITGGTRAGQIGGAVNINGGAGGTTNAGGAITITTGVGGTTSGAGGTLTLTTGANGAGGTGTSGPLNLRTGDSANGAGVGNILLQPGDALTTGTVPGGSLTLFGGFSFGAALGGNVTLQGGGANSSGGGGGSVTIQGGSKNSAGGGNPGTVTIIGGTGVGGGATAGAVTVAGGLGQSTSNGGALTLRGGDPTAGTGQAGGAVTLRGGNGATGGGTGGNVTISGGTQGGGTAGVITLQTNGSDRLKFDTDGSWDIGGTTPGSAGQALVSNGSAGPPAWTSLNGAGGPTIFVRKGADTSRASVTTVSADPDLTFSSQANGTYAIHCVVIATTALASQGLKFQLTAGGTVTFGKWSAHVADSASVGSDFYADFGTPTGGGPYPQNNSFSTFDIQGIVVTSTAGTFSFSWAQSTSSATNLTVKQGSWCTLQ